MKKIVKFFPLIFFLFPHNIYAGSLWFTEQLISLRFGVDNISHQQLKTLLPEIDNHNALLFDVRRPEEYQASRIQGSILISPDMSSQDFITQYGNKLQNKTLIFYCSVGYRSSEFIQRIEEQSTEKGVKSMVNLKGGIFRWYNEHHPIINDDGETNEIHPGNESWADLINTR